MIRLIPWGTVVFLIAIALMLAACTSAPAIKCPPLVQYSQLEQSALAAELPSDGPETEAQIEDYINLRQTCAATPVAPHS